MPASGRAGHQHGSSGGSGLGVTAAAWTAGRSAAGVHRWLARLRRCLCSGQLAACGPAWACGGVLHRAAKQRFSEMIRAVTTEGPQVITRHGEDVAVVVGIGEYRRLTQPAVDLASILLGGPSSTIVPLTSSRRSRPSTRPTSDVWSVWRRARDLPARHQCAVGDAKASASGGCSR
jgi:prevent-host-death family protein